MRTTIRLDDDLLREAKAYAAATDRTLTQLIEEAVRERLARRQAANKRPKVELPTSAEEAFNQPWISATARRLGLDGRRGVILLDVNVSSTHIGGTS